MTDCYLGLGSNLRFPSRQLSQAVQKIKDFPKTGINKVSSIYKTTPLGKGFQPGYCNQVILIKTGLKPDALLKYCQNLEKKHHRIKTRVWGPRTLDVDILIYGTLEYQSAHLSIPHPELMQRAFVLEPLLEISPKAKHPNGESLSSALQVLT